MESLRHIEISLPRVLYDTWTSLTSKQLSSESYVAFALCKRFSEHHPALQVRFEGWRNEDEQDVSTLIVYGNELGERVYFILKLLPASRVSQLLAKTIFSLRKCRIDYQITLGHPCERTSCDIEQLKLIKNCNLGIVVLPDVRTDHPSTDISRLLAHPEISCQFIIAHTTIDQETGELLRHVSGAIRHPSIPFQNNYPSIEFSLASGRTVRVHAMTLEPNFDEYVRVHQKGPSQWTPLGRQPRTITSIFGWRNHHHFHWEPSEKYEGRMPNMTIYAWLSSDPLSPEALFSDTSVMFFVEYRPGESLKLLFERGLKTLDWETLSVDVTKEFVAGLASSHETPTVH